MRTIWSNQCVGSIEVMGSSFPFHPGVYSLHSLYGGAINFVDNENGEIYSLLTKKDAIHPHAAILHSNPNQKLKISDWGLKTGQSLFIENSAIIFDCGLWVSFLGAKRTHPSDESPPNNMILNSEQISQCTMVLNKLQQYAKTELQWDCLVQDEPSGNPFMSQFREKAFALETAFSQKNLLDAIEHGLSLVGFGPGLTPTGDDFLCGYSLAAYATSNIENAECHHLPSEFTSEWLKEILHHATKTKQLTTDISLMFLKLAEKQNFSQSLLSLANSFCKNRNEHSDTYSKAISALGHHGHSSGYDAATGFLFGLGGRFHYELLLNRRFYAT